MVKRNMTIEQYIQITDWCRENKHRIQSEEVTQLRAAEEAGGVLGYEIPITSMRRCATMAKIRWANKRPEPLPTPIEREAIIILMGAIAGLYVETGKTVPTELANLQSSYVRQQQMDDVDETPEASE